MCHPNFLGYMRNASAGASIVKMHEAKFNSMDKAFREKVDEGMKPVAYQKERKVIQYERAKVDKTKVFEERGKKWGQAHEESVKKKSLEEAIKNNDKGYQNKLALEAQRLEKQADMDVKREEEFKAKKRVCLTKDRPTCNAGLHNFDAVRFNQREREGHYIPIASFKCTSMFLSGFVISLVLQLRPSLFVWLYTLLTRFSFSHLPSQVPCVCECDEARTGMAGTLCDQPSRECLNGGVVVIKDVERPLSAQTVVKEAQCKCPAGISGLECEVCNRKCKNDGILDTNMCVCHCPRGRGGLLCGVCTLEANDCQNGGTYDKETCKCTCKDAKHKGVDCSIPVCYNGLKVGKRYSYE